MRINRLGSNTALVVLSTILCLGVVELLLRLLPGSQHVYPGILYSTENADTRLWCYDEHFNGIADYDLRQAHPYPNLSYFGNVDDDPALADVPPDAVPFAIEIRVNEDQFRERPLAELRRQSSMAKLTLVIGDSFGFGQGVRVGDRFSSILEAELRQTGDGAAPAHVLVNLCKPGYNIGGVSAVMERYLGYFDRVDRVIYAFTLNDPMRTTRTLRMEQSAHDFMHQRDQQLHDMLPPGLREMDSHLLMYFARRVLRQRLSESTVGWYREMDRDNLGWQLTRNRLEDMRAACRERGASMTLVVFPLFHNLEDYPFEDIHGEIVRFARASDIEALRHSPKGNALPAGQDIIAQFS